MKNMSSNIEQGETTSVTGQLQDKVAIVTGGGRGIGEAISRRFARDGATVVIAQRSLEEGERVAQEITDAGGTALAVATDVASEESVTAMVATVLERYGKVDSLINNAGIGVVEGVLDLDLENYKKVMDVNVLGVLLATKHVGRAMRDSNGNGGAIVNLASINGLVGLPNITVYNASKGAVGSITRQTALDLGPHGIRVNAVAPGYIDNPMMRGYCDEQPDGEGALKAAFKSIPLGRFGSSDDVAAAAAFLVSDDAKWVTGTTMVVDGGTLCHGPTA
jgi:NAD(P)-dependent dehydrogenase (short-subunit alcohol dehydrogenase family)